MRVENRGSHPHCVKMCIQGVPVYCLIDSGADIYIVGGALFTTTAHLKKCDFFTDKITHTCDQQPFKVRW